MLTALPQCCGAAGVKETSLECGQRNPVAHLNSINLDEKLESFAQQLMAKVETALSRQQQLLEALSKKVDSLLTVGSQVQGGVSNDFEKTTLQNREPDLKDQSEMQESRPDRQAELQPEVLMPTLLGNSHLGKQTHLEPDKSTAQDSASIPARKTRSELSQVSASVTVKKTRSGRSETVLIEDGAECTHESSEDSILSQGFQEWRKTQTTMSHFMRKRFSCSTDHNDSVPLSSFSDSGWAQAAVRSKLFFNVTTSVILCNALYMAIASNNEAEDLYDSHYFYIVMENVFYFCFFVEPLTRFLAFRQASLCLKEPQFIFDASLTCAMVLETWIVAPITHIRSSGNLVLPTDAFRLLRLFRLVSCVGNLMSSFPELLTMTQGMVKGFRACAASVLMIMLLNFMFALACHSFMKGEDDMNNRLSELTNGMTLRTLPSCMWVFLVCGTFTLDGTGVILTELLQSGVAYHVVASILLFTYLCLANMVICNMLVDILCEVITEVGEQERDKQTSKILEHRVLTHLEKYADADGNINAWKHFAISRIDAIMQRYEYRSRLSHCTNVSRWIRYDSHIERYGATFCFPG